ncbi:MAG: hypothetical protein KC561_14135 [Myxococcales bacterium]|nr:hypothetical protein [Myxococcales bacterium]
MTSISEIVATPSNLVRLFPEHDHDSEEVLELTVFAEPEKDLEAAMSLVGELADQLFSENLQREVLETERDQAVDMFLRTASERNLLREAVRDANEGLRSQRETIEALHSAFSSLRQELLAAVANPFGARKRIKAIAQALAD